MTEQHSQPQGFLLPAEIQAILDERKATMAQFVENHRASAMYYFFRADITYSVEKFGAMAGHGFDLAMEAAMANGADPRPAYRGTGMGKKVIMSAKNLGQLIKGYELAKSKGIPAALVIDRGHVFPPSFDGDPIIVGFGMGPVYEDEVKDITKRFTMGRSPTLR